MKLCSRKFLNSLREGTTSVVPKKHSLGGRDFSPAAKTCGSWALAPEESIGHFSQRSSILTTPLAIISIFALTILLSAAPGPPIPQTAKPATSEIQLSLDPAQSKLNWTVDSTLHMVHGNFNIKQGTVRFDPETGKASGEIVVYVTSGETGNASRDEKMHKEVLQSAKYPEAIFKPTQIEGHVASTGPSDVKLHGTLNLHGADHEIVALVHSDLSNDHWTATAKFEIPFIQWGLKDPSTFLLKVKPTVNADLNLSGSLTQPK
jgi:polyisoprenoid-binding protein YceI